MISIRNGGVRFGQRWIFRGLNLRLERGSSLAVLGPNGRGKTTLVRAILGIQALHEGERQAPRVIGYVPQSIGRDVAYRVRQVVAMGRVAQRGMFALPSAIDRQAADTALDQVGMRHLADRSFDRLSGGERQLVVLARALATGADTLVLDEPASALDLRNQDLFLSVLSQLRADRSHAIVFTTHLPQHASAAADDVMMMTGAETRLHGPIGETMTEQNLSALYGIGVRIVDVEGTDGRRHQGVVPVFGKAVAS